MYANTQAGGIAPNKIKWECEYSKADIDAAREAINAACKEAIEAENPAQKCGYWCKYCPSSYRCKAAQEVVK